MSEDAALALDEIEPEDKNCNEVVGARIVEPENETWWINLAYSVRRIESVEKAEAILLRAQALHPKVAMIAFNLACYASVTGRMEEAKERLRHAIHLDKKFGNWRSTMKI